MLQSRLCSAVCCRLNFLSSLLSFFSRRFCFAQIHYIHSASAQLGSRTVGRVLLWLFLARHCLFWHTRTRMYMYTHTRFTHSQGGRHALDTHHPRSRRQLVHSKSKRARPRPTAHRRGVRVAV